MASMQLEDNGALPINGNTNGDGNLVVDGVNSLKISGEHELQQPNGHVNGNVGKPGTSSGNILPTYDEIFPALGGGLGGGASLYGPGGMMASKTGGPAIRPQPPRVRASKMSKRYQVAPGQRRDRANGRMASDIMAKTGTEIELTSSKDGTLTFLINGREDGVNKALRLLANEFEAQLKRSMVVPREYHRIILGRAGKKLNEIEQMTATKIQLPSRGEEGENADVITIAGTKEAIDKAMAEIQLISTDAASRSLERITISKIYHPFIFGPFNETLNAICAETGAKVNVPPPNVLRDEITITGDRNAVKLAKERVMAIAMEKETLCRTANIDVKKSQHKYIIGPKGNTLNEIMRQTGVSVEMPPSDSPSETITLRGEPDKLGDALSLVLAKAYSEIEEEFNVPGWIQRNILGPKGVRFQELQQQFPTVNVHFDIDENIIKLSGAVAEVRKAKLMLQQRADQINHELTIEEIKVSDPKHIKFIVGKNGSNLKQIRDETKATIQVITDDDNNNNNNNNNGSPASGGSKKSSASSSPAHHGSVLGNATLGPQFVRIEGTKEAVAKAKAELLLLLNKLENEVSYELIIERRFYGQIIGPKGDNIRDIRSKFNQVMITFPEPNGSSDKVLIRGNRKDAEQCYKYLSQLSKELLFNNYRIEVPIFSQLLKYLQGKDSIKKIREETGTRIDLPQGNMALEGSDVITISGAKDKVEQARIKLTGVINSMSDMSHVDILIPAKIHNYMLGAKGRNIKSIMAECGGVYINFPPEGSGSDKVQIMGPKECVAKAKAMLLAMSNDYQTNNYSEELKVKVEHHRYLIGKNGANINKLRDSANVRIYFASDAPSNSRDGSDSDPERILITGKKEEVQRAKALLETKIKELDNIVEEDVRIDPKWHHIFIARRAAVCKQLYDEFGGVNVSFPNDKSDDRVVLKGSKECVQQAKQRMLDIIADQEAQVTIDVHIDAQHHRQLLSRGGKVNVLQQEHDVKIKFPARPRHDDADNEGENVTNPERANIVTISGRLENCSKAKEALLALVPITEVVEIPYEFHRFIIGQKGSGVRALMDKCNVHVRVPPSEDRSNEIQVSGTAEAVELAKKELQEKLAKLEEEKSDREARSFIATAQVDPMFHPKIIGKRGATISKLRQKYDVNIQMPEANKGAEDSDNVITIQGYEAKANECREEILRMVKDFEDMVSEDLDIDHRIHSRLIGSRGKSIRAIMDQYKVDIRFPRSGDANQNLVTIMGSPEAVDDCREHLLELVDDYLDDVEVQFKPPQNHGFQINFDQLSSSGVVKENSKGFQVRGGPWEKGSENNESAAPVGTNGKGGGNVGGGGGGGKTVVDTASAQEFPAFGVGSEQVNGVGSLAWGPRRN